MKLLLLCAGFATRLEAVTRGGSKPLLEIAGRSLLDRLLDDLLDGARRAAADHDESAAPGAVAFRAGPVDEILVVTNARHSRAYEAWASSRPAEGPPVRILDDGATDNASRRGAVRDLALGIEHFRPGAPLLVAAGDNLFRFDFAELFEDYRHRPRSLVLVLRERDPARLRRSGVARLDDAGRILEFDEKPAHPRGEWVCPPVYLLEADALDELPAFLATAPDTDAPGNFVAWLARRGLVWAHRMSGERFDVGTTESWADAPAWLARGR